jgi:hypothetical protein
MIDRDEFLEVIKSDEFTAWYSKEKESVKDLTPS